jgi:hypothetical protein
MPSNMHGWLNVIDAVVIIGVVFMTLRLIVNPPRSFAEGWLEAHKVVVVGAVTLCGVALIEVYQFTQLTHELKSQEYVEILRAVLYYDAILGTCLLVAALTGSERVRKNKQIDALLLSQSALGVLVFGTAVYIASAFRIS